MTNMEGEDVFEPSFLGTADEVAQERICDDELILIKGGYGIRAFNLFRLR